MPEQRIDLNMLARIDGEQKDTASRVDKIGISLHNLEREVSEIKGKLTPPSQNPWWLTHIVGPLCVAAVLATTAAVIHLEIVVNGIGRSVSGLQVSQARQDLTTYAALPPSEFKTILPGLSSSIATARRQKVKIPSAVVDDLSKQLKTTEPSTSGFWPAAAEFISYRSALTHEDLANLANSMPRCVDTQPHPATTKNAITKEDLGKPTTVELNPAHYDNCRIQLDSPEENTKLNEQARTVLPYFSLVFNHCLVVYKGGVVRIQIPAPTLTFTGCLWNFSVSDTPPPSGQKVTEALLAGNPDSYTLTGM
jgi:hypothetical protein